MVSEHWHERRPLPNDVRRELQRLASGERALELYRETPCPIWLLKSDGETFLRAFTVNRPYLYRGGFTAPPDENDYSDCECYLIEDGAAGFAVTGRRRLISMFSNREQSGFACQTAPFIVQKADSLVCIAGGGEKREVLAELYRSALGFKVIARTENDAEVMRKYYGAGYIDDFISHYGPPYHIFMKSSPRNGEIRVFKDYFEAEAYADSYGSNRI